MRISPVSQFNSKKVNFCKKQSYVENKVKSSRIKTAALCTTALALGAIGATLVLNAKKPNKTKAIRKIADNFNGANSEVTEIIKHTKEQTAIIQDYIASIAKEAQGKRTELIRLFNSGEDIAQDGTALREIKIKNYTTAKMRELSSDKKFLRETIFVNGTPQHVEETFTNEDLSVTNIIYTFLDDKLDFYTKKVKSLGDNEPKCLRIINYGSDIIQNDGLPKCYSEDYKLISESREKCLKQLTFSKGVANTYMEDIVDLDDFTTRIGKKVILGKDGNPTDIIIGLNTTFKSADRAYGFIDGKWQDMTAEVAKRYCK